MRQQPINAHRGRPVARGTRNKRLTKPTRDRNGNAVLPQTPTLGPADLYPRDVTIDLGGVRARTERKSRIIITDQWLYIATSPNKGYDVTEVLRFPHPPGKRKAGEGHSGSWGHISWTGCSCGNSWSRHSKATLVKMGDDAAETAAAKAATKTDSE